MDRATVHQSSASGPAQGAIGAAKVANAVVQRLGIFVCQSRADLVDVGFILNSARGWSRAKDERLE